MITLIANESRLLKDLNMYLEPVEIYDAAGTLLGLFVPGNLEKCKELYAQAAAKVDWAGVERRRLSKEKGEPFEITLSRLQMLDKEMARRKAAGEKEFTKEEALAYCRSLRKQGMQQASHPPLPQTQPETGSCVIR